MNFAAWQGVPSTPDRSKNSVSRILIFQKRLWKILKFEENKALEDLFLVDPELAPADSKMLLKNNQRSLFSEFQENI